VSKTICIIFVVHLKTLLYRSTQSGDVSNPSKVCYFYYTATKPLSKMN